MNERTVLLNGLLGDAVFAALWSAGVRARVGVSACLVGEPVRYDGEHRCAPPVAELLVQFVELAPLCPEVAIGMGVPRPPIQRVRLADGGERVLGVGQPGLDVTGALDHYAAAVVHGQRLDGYVFKARSPSCAPGSAPVFDDRDRQVDTGWGRYAGRLRTAWPDLPMADEESLAARDALAAFILGCYRQASFRRGKSG